MNKIKDTIRKIAPFVKNYKKGFIFAIILIISAAVFTALAPMVEGFIITQLTNDSLDIIRGVEGASVNFKYILNLNIIFFNLYLLLIFTKLKFNIKYNYNKIHFI